MKKEGEDTRTKKREKKAKAEKMEKVGNLNVEMEKVEAGKAGMATTEESRFSETLRDGRFAIEEVPVQNR
ncbi:hypothetical protein [uncultured Bacteroides sp.]|uniref:hypothetical protein n=1 Tax=uncultured Bacteroides sp. TaxID=162156 RepID=UPI0025CF7C01|nr:hypothetical protein [uncultured Bacteroides sp.]